MSERLLSPKEVKKRFSVSDRTLYSYEKQGKIHPARTPGGHRRYLESELLNLFQRESDANNTNNDPGDTD